MRYSTSNVPCTARNTGTDGRRNFFSMDVPDGSMMMMCRDSVPTTRLEMARSFAMFLFSVSMHVATVSWTSGRFFWDAMNASCSARCGIARRFMLRVDSWTPVSRASLSWSSAALLSSLDARRPAHTSCSTCSMSTGGRVNL